MIRTFILRCLECVMTTNFGNKKVRLGSTGPLKDIFQGVSICDWLRFSRIPILSSLCRSMSVLQLYYVYIYIFRIIISILQNWRLDTSNSRSFVNVFCRTKCLYWVGDKHCQTHYNATGSSALNYR